MHRDQNGKTFNNHQFSFLIGRGYLPGPLRLLRTYLPGPLRLLRTYLPGPLRLLRTYLPGPLRCLGTYLPGPLRLLRAYLPGPLWQKATHLQGSFGEEQLICSALDGKHCGLGSIIILKTNPFKLFHYSDHHHQPHPLIT
jgi:hypothetical protein